MRKEAGLRDGLSWENWQAELQIISLRWLWDPNLQTWQEVLDFTKSIFEFILKDKF